MIKYYADKQIITLLWQAIKNSRETKKADKKYFCRKTTGRVDLRYKIKAVLYFSLIFKKLLLKKTFSELTLPLLNLRYDKEVILNKS